MRIILIINNDLCGYLDFKTYIAHGSERHSTRQPNSEKNAGAKVDPYLVSKFFLVHTTVQDK